MRIHRKANNAGKRWQAGHRKVRQNRFGLRAGAGVLWAATSVLLGGFVVLAGIAGGGFRAVPPLLEQIDRLAAKIGLGLETISLTGFDATDDKKVFTALGLENSQTLLAFDARLARQRLKALPSVEDVRIKQAFPSRLEVIIKERQPYAIWLDPQGGAIVDREGRPLMVAGNTMGGDLPAIAGHGAPQAAAALFKKLAEYPELNPLKMLAIRVADRRWTLALPGCRYVLLPEKHVGLALSFLMSGRHGERPIDLDFAVLDLRVAGQTVVRRRPETILDRKSSPALPARTL